MNTIYIFHCLWSWSGPLAVYNQRSLYISVHGQLLATLSWYYLSNSVIFLNEFQSLSRRSASGHPDNSFVQVKKQLKEKVFVAEKQYSFLCKNTQNFAFKASHYFSTLPPAPLSLLIRQSNKPVLKTYIFLSHCPLARPWCFFLRYSLTFSKQRCVLSSPHFYQKV